MTKVATIDTRRFFALLLIAAMVIAMIPIGVAVFPCSVLADNTSIVTGNFTVNSGGLDVNSVTLHSHPGGGETGSMSPTTEYEIWVNITENTTLETISTIVLTLYWDSDGTYGFGDMPVSASNDNCAIITYTNLGTDTWVLSNSSTTWVADHGEAPTMTGITGDFKFHFTVGKVARETTGLNEWHAYALATDKAANTDSNYKENLTMNWYGEITGVTSTVTFGNVTLGQVQAASGNISATYISNGDYDEMARTTSTWNGSSENLTLDVDGNPGDSAFSIQADDAASIGAQVYLQSLIYVSIDATQSLTADVTGNVEGTNTLWLTLGATGIPAETYTGTVYFAIANR